MSDNQKTKFIIGIAGASGAGKSRMAELLHQQLSADLDRSDVAVLNEDAYYLDRSEISYEERCKINYDHPDALEHSLLAEHLQQLRRGESIALPQYDYAQHNRMEERLDFSPPRILILEGILLLSQAMLREQMDLKVFVDVPLDLCLTRRLYRDIGQRGRSLDSVLQQYEMSVRPMFYEFIEPSKRHADLIVPGGGENESALEVLSRYLKGVLVEIEDR